MVLSIHEFSLLLTGDSRVKLKGYIDGTSKNGIHGDICLIGLT